MIFSRIWDTVLTNFSFCFVSVLYTLCILCLFTICILYRCLLFVFELEHSCSRYEDDKHKILKAAFHFELKGIIVFVVCLIYFVYHVTKYKTLYLDNREWYLAIPFLFILYKLLDLVSGARFY